MELGANDGLQQSNTLALEQLFGWRGILVEADPALAAECRRNRPGATVVCTAAGTDWSIDRLPDDDLTSSLGGATGALVPVAPLSAILDAAGMSEGPDIMSLDVEGFEVCVLAGLDLTRHGPRHLLVETDNPGAVQAALGSGFELVAAWTYHDYLFERRQPEADALGSAIGDR